MLCLYWPLRLVSHGFFGGKPEGLLSPYIWKQRQDTPKRKLVHQRATITWSLTAPCSSCLLSLGLRSGVGGMTQSHHPLLFLLPKWAPAHGVILALSFEKTCPPSLNHGAHSGPCSPSVCAQALLAESPLTHQGTIMPRNHSGFSRLNVLSPQVLPAAMESVRMLF